MNYGSSSNYQQQHSFFSHSRNFVGKINFIDLWRHQYNIMPRRNCSKSGENYICFRRLFKACSVRWPLASDGWWNRYAALFSSARLIRSVQERTLMHVSAVHIKYSRLHRRLNKLHFVKYVKFLNIWWIRFCTLINNSSWTPPPFWYLQQSENITSSIYWFTQIYITFNRISIYEINQKSWCENFQEININ